MRAGPPLPQIKARLTCDALPAFTLWRRGPELGDGSSLECADIIIGKQVRERQGV